MDVILNVQLIVISSISKRYEKTERKKRSGRSGDINALPKDSTFDRLREQTLVICVVPGGDQAYFSSIQDY